MANIFPTLSQSSAVTLSPLNGYAMMMYPSTQTFAYVTRVIQFVNSTEQRWVNRTVLYGATLQYTDLNGYDLSILWNFFSSMKGSYIDDSLLNTFSITVAGQTYNYMMFDQDSFDPVVSKTELFQLTLKVKQVRPN